MARRRQPRDIFPEKEAHQILVDRSLNVRHHMCLQEKVEAYARLEDHERKDFFLEQFRVLWEAEHEGWDWDPTLQPTRKQNPRYHRMHEAVKNFFRERAKIRGGFVKLPADVRGTTWKAEAVCGWIYGPEIKAWVLSRTGLAPGSKPFLSMFRIARRGLFRKFSPEERSLFQATAAKWNLSGPPLDVKLKSFRDKFGSSCRAFSLHCLKEYGVLPVIVYAGLPGTGINANMYEIMKQQGLAKTTFRKSYTIGGTLNAFQSYVNQQAVNIMQNSDGVQAPKLRSQKYMDSIPYTFRLTDIEGQRLVLDPERLPPDWEKTICLPLFYQVLCLAHCILSPVSDLSPPWLALEHQIGEMLAEPCILPGRIIKGGPKHTGVRVVREYLRHWFHHLGYIEFIQFKDGTIQPPSPSPWWKRNDASVNSWYQQADQSEEGAVSVGQSSGRYSTAFGSKGAKLCLAETIEVDAPEKDKPYAEFVKLPDPADLHLCNPPSYQPSEPAWPAPAIVPSHPYARGQWAALHLKELQCGLADSFLSSVLLLVQLPEAVHNRHYEVTRFTTPGERYYEPDFPDFLSWRLDRSHLVSQTEVNMLCAFLRTRKWSFRDKRDRVVFSGLETTWCYVLGAVLLLRAMRHKSELAADSPAVWALSGCSASRERAASLSVEISEAELQSVSDEFREYLHDVSSSVRHPGVPPGLLYAFFDSRLEYVWSLISHLPSLVELFDIVQRMPNAGDRDDCCDCPELSGDSIWIRSSCGIPKSTHKMDAGEGQEVLLAWWRREDLFLDSDSGVSRNIETGLAVLAQIGMLASDLRYLGGVSTLDAPSYLSHSWLSDPVVIEDITDALELQARLHIDLLRDALPDVDGDPWRSEYARDETFDLIPDDDPAERLETALTSQPTNPMQDLVDEGVANESMAAATQKNLRNVRRDQNQLNMQLFGTAHPPRSIPEPTQLPEFDDLHNESPLIPRTIPPPPATSRRRKDKQVVQPDVVLRVPTFATCELNVTEESAARPSSGKGRRKRARPPEPTPESTVQIRDNALEVPRKRLKTGNGKQGKQGKKTVGRADPVSAKRMTRSTTRAVVASARDSPDPEWPDDDWLMADGDDDDGLSSLVPHEWTVSATSESEPDYTEYPEARAVITHGGSGSGVRLRLGLPVTFSPGPSESEDPMPLMGTGVPRPKARRATRGIRRQAGPSTNFS